MGNIQLLEDGVLRIVSHRGFDAPLPDPVRSGASALSTRVIVENVDSAAMLAAGVRAYQSTPLISRSGQMVGMFSTHYRTPRRPGERELRLLDVLSRQAADLIERKRAEAALLSSESRFRQLADSMPADRLDRQSQWRDRGLLQRPLVRVHRHRTRYLFDDVAAGRKSMHPDDHERTLSIWHESVETGKPFRIEYRFWDRRDHHWRWFMGRALPVRDESGSIVKWFGTSTDIDEQKHVEDELRRANDDLEQFAWSASHDLQEPLRSIKIYGELLSKRYGHKLDGQAAEFLGYLRSGATRMEILVRDLLTYTQVTRLDGPAEVDATDVGEAVAATLANLSSDHRGKRRTYYHLQASAFCANAQYAPPAVVSEPDRQCDQISETGFATARPCERGKAKRFLDFFGARQRHRYRTRVQGAGFWA